MGSKFYFDDCTICGAVEDAHKEGRTPTEAELTRAFKAQE